MIPDETEQFIYFRELREVLGWSQWRLGRRLRELGVPVYESRRARRDRMIRREDIARLVEPKEIVGRGGLAS